MGYIRKAVREVLNNQEQVLIQERERRSLDLLERMRQIDMQAYGKVPANA